jgi:hypothetical protein
LGEIVTFASYKYSRYDSSSVYEFTDAKGQTKEWWLGDEQSPTIALEIFSLADTKTSGANPERSVRVRPSAS